MVALKRIPAEGPVEAAGPDTPTVIWICPVSVELDLTEEPPQEPGMDGLRLAHGDGVSRSLAARPPTDGAFQESNRDYRGVAARGGLSAFPLVFGEPMWSANWSPVKLSVLLSSISGSMVAFQSCHRVTSWS